MQKQPTKTDVYKIGCSSPEGNLLPSLGQGVVRESFWKMLDAGRTEQLGKAFRKNNETAVNTVAGTFLNIIQVNSPIFTNDSMRQLPQSFPSNSEESGAEEG